MEKYKRERAYAYVEAANGMLVRIPVDRLKDWRKAQDELKAGIREPNPEMVKEIEEYIERIKKARRERNDSV